MTDFDPDNPLEDKASHDEYVGWCSMQFSAAMQSVVDMENVPHGLTARAARLLYVASVAPIHLDDDCDILREQHLENIGRLFTVARKTERGHEDVGVRDWLVARAVVDCYMGTGRFANNLLDAARCAISGIILTAVHPLVDLGTVHAPDAWALLLYGMERLNEIDTLADEPLGPWDFAVLPNQPFIDRMNWQKVNNAAAQMGAPPMSPN